MKKRFYYILVLLISVSVFSCSDSKVKIELDGFESSSVIDLATDELNLFWGKVSPFGKSNYKFIFKLDPTFQNGEFSYKVISGKKIVFSGGSSVDALHAVYSFLEEIGYTFDITGVTYPRKLDLSVIETIDKTISPRVRWRGIRQHVNFPMDISSYPIDEAKDYLKNLVRLRFNKLTIHSYPEQWYNVVLRDTTYYAGHFFYGDRHYIYDNELLKSHVRFNDSTFCIPEAEHCYNDTKARSEVAIDWMQQLISYAKAIGLNIQFSFEPRLMSSEDAASIAHQIVKTYPNIDALEFITEETGGWGPSCTEQEVKNTLHKYFSPEIANDPIITSPIRPKQSDLNNLYTQIGIISNAIKLLEDDEAKTTLPELKLGIYCTVSQYSPGAYRLARTALPDKKICIMPSHGSEGVARDFNRIVTSKSDADKTEIYSWVEFDGLMYLQQNGLKGIARLMSKMDSLNGAGQHNSLLFNHWRTAENRTIARFASLAALYGMTSVKEFYDDYAIRLGIIDKELFAEAMNKINDVDSYATHALGNIGFCWVGAWKNGGSYTWMSIENIEKARRMYLEAGEMIAGLLSSTETSAGKEYLSFLGNRILCTVIYLNAFREATEIRTIDKDQSGEISEADKNKAKEICNHALLVFDQYMKTHAAYLPDRGCEGTMVSVWNAPMRGLKVLRSRLGGIPMEMLPYSDTPVDAPPLPIFYENMK